MAEATALRNGVHATILTGYRSMVLEGGNQVLIKALKGEIQTLWEIQTLVVDAKKMPRAC